MDEQARNNVEEEKGGVPEGCDSLVWNPIAANSILSWSTLDEFTPSSFCLPFAYKLQKIQPWAFVSRLCNKFQYRIIYASILVVYSSNDSTEIREEFARIKAEHLRYDALTTRLNEILAEREENAEEVGKAQKEQKYFCCSKQHLRFAMILDTLRIRIFNSVQPVFYFTRRRPVFEGKKLRFRNEIGTELTFGVCDVKFPVDFTSFKMERMNMVMTDKPFDRKDEQENVLAYYNFCHDMTLEKAKDLYMAEDPNEEEGKRDLLLYIHGYNADFKGPVESLAKVGVGINWKGALCCYCWPTKGRSTDYFVDYENAYAERDFLKQCLELFASEESPYERVTILAHSMGNHLLFETIAICEDLRNRQNHTFFNIIAAHANIPRDRFRKVVSDFSWMAEHWNAIGDTRDIPLCLAKFQGSQLGIPLHHGEESIQVEVGEQEIRVHYIVTDTFSNTWFGAHSLVKQECCFDILEQVVKRTGLFEPQEIGRVIEE